MFKRKGLSLIGLVLLFGGLVLSGCQEKATPKSDKLRIVTTTNFYGEMARAVGGDLVSVQSIINQPSVDPHNYEPTPTVAKQVAQAQIVIANGIGYDGWMNKLVKTAPKVQFIRVGENVMGKRDGANEHLWYDVQTMPKAAKYLANQLAKKDPQHRDVYQKNAKAYIASLKPVSREVAKLKRQVRQLPNRRVFVSEPVFDYALETIGLNVTNVNFENAVEKGTDSSPQVIKQMRTGLNKRQVALFVNNKQVVNHTVTSMVQLAKAAKVPVLQVTETMPAKTTYQQWMLQQYRQLNQLLARK